jgi:hypothetical protein
MKTLKFTASVLTVLTGLSLPVKSQSSEATPVPPPKSPLVASPRTGTAWQVVLTPGKPIALASPGKSEKPARDVPVSATYRKDAGSVRATLQMENGNILDGYVFESYSIRGISKSNNAFVVPAVVGLDAVLEFFVSTYPATQWISLDYYKGVEKFEEVDCYVFDREPIAEKKVAKNDKDAGSPDSDIVDKLRLRAYIRVADKVPVFIQIGETPYRFVQPVDWKGSNEMPRPYAAAAAGLNKEVEILKALRRE